MSVCICKRSDFPWFCSDKAGYTLGNPIQLIFPYLIELGYNALYKLRWQRQERIYRMLQCLIHIGIYFVLLQLYSQYELANYICISFKTYLSAQWFNFDEQHDLSYIIRELLLSEHELKTCILIMQKFMHIKSSVFLNMSVIDLEILQYSFLIAQILYFTNFSIFEKT